MNKIKPYLKAAMKVLGSLAVPLALLFLLYRLILNIPVNWWFLLYFLPIMSIASAHHYVPMTLDTGIQPSEDFSGKLKKRLAKSPWELISETGESLLLRPKFDWPFSWIYREQLLVDLSGNQVRITGAKVYVKRLKAFMDEKKTLWDRSFFRISIYLLLILALMLPALNEYGVVTSLRIRLHEYKTREVAILALEETGLPGNTENNLNSYGGAVESEDYFFFIKNNLKLCRSDKDFKNETALIDKRGGTGMSYLNTAGEWIFFTSGKTMNRIKTDGSGQETIYSMGYLLDVHLLDNWIYFINHVDHFKLYKMDINGKNLHALSDISMGDFSIFDGRIYYSHEKDGQGLLESMDLDGGDVRFVADILPFDMVKKGDALYYTDKRDFNLYKYMLDGTGTPEKLVDRELSRFIVAKNCIYFSLKSEDVGYPGSGLYKIGLDGGLSEKITDGESIESMSFIGEWILFHSGEGHEWPTLKRMPISSQSIIEMD